MNLIEMIVLLSINGSIIIVYLRLNFSMVFMVSVRCFIWSFVHIFGRFLDSCYFILVLMEEDLALKAFKIGQMFIFDDGPMFIFDDE